MFDVMIDIETLSLDKDAAIVSIGAVMFDPLADNREEPFPYEFFSRVDIESNEKFGRKISADTVLWWMQQNAQARDQFRKGGKALNEVLWLLFDFLTAQEQRGFTWANSPDFDLVILERAFAACDVSWPVKFWQYRDVRTAKHLSGVEPPDKDSRKAHNALYDAQYQALVIQHCYRGKS